MKPTRILLLTATGAFTAAVAIQAIHAAQPSSSTPPAASGDGLESDWRPGALIRQRIDQKLDQLKITLEQREQLKGVLNSHKDEGLALLDRVITERRALRDLIESGSTDRIAYETQVRKLGAVQVEVAMLRAKLRAEILPILTPEQREKAKQLRDRIEDRVDAILERVTQEVP